MTFQQISRNVQRDLNDRRTWWSWWNDRGLTYSLFIVFSECKPVNDLILIELIDFVSQYKVNSLSRFKCFRWKPVDLLRPQHRSSRSQHYKSRSNTLPFVPFSPMLHISSCCCRPNDIHHPSTPVYFSYRRRICILSGLFASSWSTFCYKTTRARWQFSWSRFNLQNWKAETIFRIARTSTAVKHFPYTSKRLVYLAFYLKQILKMTRADGHGKF